jgi:hypothetical protein
MKPVHRSGYVEDITVPKPGDSAWLFRLRIAGYSIRVWECYGVHRSDNRTTCGVEARRAGKVVYRCGAFCPPTFAALDGKQAKLDVCGFVAADLDDDMLAFEAEQRWGDA